MREPPKLRVGLPIDRCRNLSSRRRNCLRSRADSHMRRSGNTPMSSARLRLQTLPARLACDATQPVRWCSLDIACIIEERRHGLFLVPPQSDRSYQRTQPGGGSPNGMAPVVARRIAVRQPSDISAAGVSSRVGWRPPTRRTIWILVANEFFFLAAASHSPRRRSRPGRHVACSMQSA